MSSLPKYKVWQEGQDGDVREFYAPNPESAAEMFAEDDFDGVHDGEYQSGLPMLVQDESGVILRFEVLVEFEPTYYVTPMPVPVITPT